MPLLAHTCLVIGGVAYDQWLEAGTLSLENVRGSEPDQLTFSLVVDAPRPPDRAEVLYYEPGFPDPIFGGVVMDVGQPTIGGNGVTYEVSCNDWREQLDAKLLNARWVGLTSGEILVRAVAAVAPQFDTSLVALDGPVVPSLTFRRNGRLTDLLELLSQAVGYVWDVTPTKQLTWGPPGATPAPFGLSDTSFNFGSLSLRVNSDDLATVVYVKGRPQPSSVASVDRFVGDALTSRFRLSGTPYGLNNYVLLQGDFPRGIDAGTWVETDATNPSPPPGHTPSDGYLFTTLQQGVSLAESGWLQVVGGTGTWGQVRLMSVDAYPRGDGRHRYEWEVYVEAAPTEGMFGLWDAANQGTQGGVRYGFSLDAAGEIKAWANGAIQTPTHPSALIYAAGDTIRFRVIPKGASGAVLSVNQNALGGFPASDWVAFLDTNLGSWTSWVVAAVFNKSFNGRVRRIRAFAPLYDMDLTVDGDSLTVGLLGVDEDAGVDALVGVAADVPVLAFFADTIPPNNAEIELIYYEAVPTLVRVPDVAAIAAIRAIENPADDPDGPDGVYEAQIVDDKIDSTRMASFVATQALAERANPQVLIEFETIAPGLRAGQLLPVHTTSEAVGHTINRSFLIQRVSLKPFGVDGEHTRVVQGTTRLRGVDGLFVSLLRRPDVLPQFEDSDGPLDEFLSGADVITLGDAGSLAGPALVGTGTLSLGGVGQFAQDTNTSQLYAIGAFGASIMT